MTPRVFVTVVLVQRTERAKCMKKVLSSFLAVVLCVCTFIAPFETFAVNTDFTPNTAIETTLSVTYTEKSLSTGSEYSGDYSDIMDYLEDGDWKYYYYCDFTPQYSATYTISIRSSKLMTAELYDADGNLLASESSPSSKNYTVDSTSYYYFDLSYDLEAGTTYYYKIYFSGGTYSSVGTFFYTLTSGESSNISAFYLYVNNSSGYVYELADYSVSELLSDLSATVIYTSGSFTNWSYESANGSTTIDGVTLYIDTSDCSAEAGEHTVVAHYQGYEATVSFYICEGHSYVAGYTVDPTCTEDGYTFYYCENCYSAYQTSSNSYTEAISATGHTWDDGTVTTAATCTEEGVMTYTCTVCGTTKTEAISATGHTWDDGTVTTAATCTEEGVMTYTCTVCGTTKTEAISATGHTAGEAVVENNVDPTCEETGSYDEVVYCTVCGAELSREAVTVEATGHSFTNYVSNDDATCTEDGTKTAECDNDCGTTDTVTDEGSATGHSFTNYVSNGDATCTVDGTKTAECDNGCGTTDTVTDSFSRLGHDYVTTVTDPTCTEEGYTTYTCTRGDSSYDTDYVSATGHSYVATVTDPTCTEEGYTTYTCTVCGDTYTSDYVSALDHNYVATVVEATCTEDGYTLYECTRCDSSFVDAIVSATGHSYEAVVTAPTCTEDGYTTYTCTVCGYSYISDSVAALGHSYVVTEAVDATCTEDGYIVYTCENDSSHTYTETFEAIGHSYVTTETVDATCTEDGYIVYTCENDASHTYTEVLEALGHDYEIVETDATCTEAGYTTYTCTRCDDTYTTDGTTALGHDYVATETVDATCTEDGYIIYVCSRCDDTYTEILEATGHSWDEGTVTTEPTCTDEGVLTYTCENDESHTYTEAISATGHTEGEAVIENNVDPTCTETGSYDTVVYCTVCGAELSRETTTVEATGHSFTNYVSNGDATCTEDGTKTAECNNGCGTTDTVTDEGSATGHSFTNYVSNGDATCTEDGTKTAECDNGCGTTDTVTDEGTATGHSYEWVIASNNYPTKTCSVCGDVKVILAFNDISTETEYFDYIAYTSYYNSLITGVKANSTDTTTETFSPRTSLTRAMLVTILYRMAGSPYDDANPYSKTPFSDVKAGTWYYNAVCWALDNGITTETKFKPNTNVTREQTATFLYRYAGEYLGQDVSTDNDISSYPDASSVSAYAQTAMAWANDKGMITGTQQGYLNPQGTTLRVHATKILYGFGTAYNIGEFEE